MLRMFEGFQFNSMLCVYATMLLHVCYSLCLTLCYLYTIMLDLCIRVSYVCLNLNPSKILQKCVWSKTNKFTTQYYVDVSRYFPMLTKSYWISSKKAPHCASQWVSCHAILDCTMWSTEDSSLALPVRLNYV